MKVENHSEKLTQFKTCIHLFLRLEYLSKMEQDELKKVLLKYIPNGW